MPDDLHARHDGFAPDLNHFLATSAAVRVMRVTRLNRRFKLMRI